jgi:hypothetical protein
LTGYQKASIITLTTTTGTAMKTNKEKNLAHDAKMQERMRPAPKEYQFEALEAIMRAWVLSK